MTQSTDAHDSLAAELVTEALEGIDKLLSPEELEVIRALVETELVATEEGRQLLRSCRPDPVVAESGDVPVSGRAPARKRGTKGA